MALITWSDTLSVGVEEIDNQHKKLVSLINHLHEAMHSGQGKEAMAIILDRLIQYTAFHFKTEENLMQTHKYPQSISHTQEHQGLVKAVLELQKGYSEGKTGITLETMNFLKNWLNHHILQIDKQFGKYLNSKGVH
jgi:hemerythrin